MSDYRQFLEAKRRRFLGAGVPYSSRNEALFPFQRELVRRALDKGRYALFADCGLGKTLMELEWATNVPGRALVLAPIAVSHQIKAEAERFGYEAEVAFDGKDRGSKIVLSNYEKLHRFDPDEFSAVVLDESSILKAYDGKTKARLIEAWRGHRFKLAATATPAPNDFMELGNHAEFLGVMTRAEMLSMFFVHDGGSTQDWRLKGHARREFWRWIGSWASMVRSPSDLGDDDSAYRLPPMTVEHTVVEADFEHDALFPGVLALNLNERRRARRSSLRERVEAAASLPVNGEPWLFWCDLNDESAALRVAIPGAVEVRGSDSDEHKKKAALWFSGNLCLCQKHEKKSSHTCGNGTPRTASEYASTGARPETEETSAGVSDTPPRGSFGKLTKRQSKSGSAATEKSDSGNGSRNTGSRPTSTESSCNGKAEAAPSVAGESTRTMPGAHPPVGSVGCTSTTATRPARSGESSAQPAILGSASSETTPNSSGERTCTCGHESGRRVLISKSSIFGWGLNFQACSRMAFVGLSDSYEAFYQATRRCWRFGQENPVTVHLIYSEHERAVIENVLAKESAHKAMQDALVLEVMGNG